MRILHVIPDVAPSSGGPPSAVLGMAEAQSKAGHLVAIAATDFGRPELPSLNGIEIRLYPCDFARWRWSHKLKRGLIPHIKNADIVHIHTMWNFPVLAAASLCTALDKPYVLRPCGMLDPWSLSQRRWRKRLHLLCFGNEIIRKAAAIHFTSEQERTNSILSTGVRRPFVCPLGVSYDDDAKLPDPAAFRKRFPELGQDLLILFLGRLHYKKQPAVLVRAFQKVAVKNPHVRLILAGSGNENFVQKLRNLVNDLGLKNRVLFTGMLSGLAKQEALAAADLFVLPSLHENFGISVVEAMAAGCPVIVSDQVNIARDIIRARAGIVCPAKASEIADAISKLIHDEELHKRMGENGRRLFQDQFEWRNVTRSLLNEYDRLLHPDSTNQLNVSMTVDEAII